MSFTTVLICCSLLAQKPAGEIDPDHAKNSIYHAARTTGLNAEGAAARLPDPLLRDEMTAQAQRTALLDLCESTKSLENFLARGVTAPIKFKLRDHSGASGTVRAFDIWFVVHAGLDEIQTDDLSSQNKNSGSTDSEGMHFDARAIEEDELKTLGIIPTGKTDRFGRIESQLLDKVEMKVTNRTLATRCERSLVVATQTVPNLQDNEQFRNIWRSVDLRSGKTTYGPWQPYAGVIGYTKASRLDFQPGVLLVEIHGAYAEPKGWFNGRGYLKTKIPLVSEQKVRELRREIAKRRAKAAGRAS
jgi:hypothetical protein